MDEILAVIADASPIGFLMFVIMVFGFVILFGGFVATLAQAVYYACRYPEIFYQKWHWFQFGHKRWPYDALCCSIDSTQREIASKQ